ncbi:hypothetical protein [Archangium sp.]|jgi:hypothetical protein|uniref:hypothetical protein n=1 Tax=Archangium sp. TaxID=1872627 RepID=UPI003899C96D
MHKTMKMTLAALASVALIPAGVTAHEVRAPHPGTVTALTYYSSGAFHGAIDVASGSGCGYWGVETGVVGSVSWNVTIRTTGTVCYGNGSGNQNEAKHIWTNGYSYRVWHFLKTANSYDRTCDRCQVGDEGGTGNVTGPHSHIQYDLNGSNDTSWYANYTVKGEAVDRSETLGYLD